MVKCGVLFEVRTGFLNKNVGELRLQRVKLHNKQQDVKIKEIISL
jgi:hypothetical protein